MVREEEFPKTFELKMMEIARWTRRSTGTIFPKTLNNEIPKAKKSIDSGGPNVPGDREGPIQKFSMRNTSSGTTLFRLERSEAGKGDTIWRGFFVQRYSKKSNPPVIRETGWDGWVRDHRNRTRRDHRERDPGPKVRDHRKKK